MSFKVCYVFVFNPFQTNSETSSCFLKIPAINKVKTSGKFLKHSKIVLGKEKMCYLFNSGLKKTTVCGWDVRE